MTAKEDVKTTASNVKTEVKGAASDIKTKMSNGLNDVREIAGNAGTALQASGKAYMSGLSELASLVSDATRETLNDTSEHVRASARAKSIRDLAEMNAEYAQRRLEMGATYTKEYIDLLHSKTLEMFAPFGKLVEKEVA